MPDNLPILRKNIKFFTNGKNKPLVELANMIFDGDRVISVEAVPVPIDTNTRLQLIRDKYPLLAKDSTKYDDGERYEQRNIMYNRLNLGKALALAFTRSPVTGAYVVDPEGTYNHPVSVQEFLGVLNNMFDYDANKDDITITYTGGANYTVTSKTHSLSFYGQDSVDLGKPGVTPEKIPSHDSVWADVALDNTIDAVVNGIDVPTYDVRLMDQASVTLAEFQTDTQSVLWFIWLNQLEGEATLTARNDGAKVAAVNINQTTRVVDKSLEARYVGFKPSEIIPEYKNPLEIEDFKHSVSITLPGTFANGKVLGLWINGVRENFADLYGEVGIKGLRLGKRVGVTDPTLFDLIHDGAEDLEVVIRGEIATLPALIDPSFRLFTPLAKVPPIQARSTAPMLLGPVEELDEFNHELYCMHFPKEVAPEIKPSIVTPMVPSNQSDYSRAVEKVSPGFTMVYDKYMTASPTILEDNLNEWSLSAVADNVTFPNKFPMFFLILKEDWDFIVAQPSDTHLGSYTQDTENGVATDITVGYMMASSTITDNGDRFLCLMTDLPAHGDSKFVLNFSPNGAEYENTTTEINLNLHYTKPSLIAPAPMNYTILRALLPTLDGLQFGLLQSRQQAIQRFLNQSGDSHTINFEYAPWVSAGESDTPDKNGDLILQLIRMPADAVAFIKTLSTTKPDVQIIRFVDSGTNVTTTYKALELVQMLFTDTNTGEGYFYVTHPKNASVSSTWSFICDYDGPEFIYHSTTTEVIVTDSVVDLPLIPFTVSLQETGGPAQYASFKPFALLVDPAADIFDWEEQRLIINDDSSAGTFERFGEVQTDLKNSIVRLMLPLEGINWIRDTHLPGDTVMFRLSDVASGFEALLDVDYLRSIPNPEAGIPLPSPAFPNRDEVRIWQTATYWYGMGLPARPVPSPYPNLQDGTINTTITNRIVPFNDIPSKFEFTSRFSQAQYRDLLSKIGKTEANFSKVALDEYTVTTRSSSDPLAAEQDQVVKATWTTEDNLTLLQVIEIDVDVFEALTALSTEADVLNHDFITVTSNNGEATDTKKLTGGDILNLAVVTESVVLLPVVFTFKRPVDFSNPLQAPQSWVADYSKLNTLKDIYVGYDVVLSTKLYNNKAVKPTINLTGADVNFKGDELAKLQWPDHDYMKPADLDLTVNNNFGTWNINQPDKGKFGYVTLTFAEDSLRLIETANAVDGTVVMLTVFAHATTPGGATFTVDKNYTAAQLKAALALGSTLSSNNKLMIPLQILNYRGDYQYSIDIGFEGTNTATVVQKASINNLTEVKDETPVDLVFTPYWILPTSNEEAKLWAITVGADIETLADLNTIQESNASYRRRVTLPNWNKSYAMAIQFPAEMKDRMQLFGTPAEAVIGKIGTPNDDGEIDYINITAGQIYTGITKDDTGETVIVQKFVNQIGRVRNCFVEVSTPGVKAVTVTLIGDDVPVVVESDVTIVDIQKDGDTLVETLRLALNPAYAQIATNTATKAVINKAGPAVTNVLNNLSRTLVGKKWVIPAGISVAQMALMPDESSIVVKITAESGQVEDSTTTIAQVKQFQSEGWSWTNTDTDVEYAIFPILMDLEDVEVVSTTKFDIAYGFSAGALAPWFNNVDNNVTVSYSMKDALTSNVDVVMPTNEQLLAIVGAEAIDTYVAPNMIDGIDFYDGIEINFLDYNGPEYFDKKAPLFVTFEKDQIDMLTGAATTVLAKMTTNTIDLETDTINGTAENDITLESVRNAKLVDGIYYIPAPVGVVTVDGWKKTVSVTADFDGADGDWLPSTMARGMAFWTEFDVNCLGALNYAGVIDAEVVNFTARNADKSVDIPDTRTFIEQMAVLNVTAIELTEFVDPDTDEISCEGAINTAGKIGFDPTKSFDIFIDGDKFNDEPVDLSPATSSMLLNEKQIWMFGEGTSANDVKLTFTNCDIGATHKVSIKNSVPGSAFTLPSVEGAVALNSTGSEVGMCMTKCEMPDVVVSTPTNQMVLSMPNNTTAGDCYITVNCAQDLLAPDAPIMTSRLSALFDSLPFYKERLWLAGPTLTTRGDWQFTINNNTHYPVIVKIWPYSPTFNMFVSDENANPNYRIGAGGLNKDGIIFHLGPIPG